MAMEMERTKRLPAMLVLAALIILGVLAVALPMLDSDGETSETTDAETYDSSASGSASSPLSALHKNADVAAGMTYYVSVDGLVQIVKSTYALDEGGEATVSITSVTDGYGLTVSDGTCYGTLTKAGTITLRLSYDGDTSSKNTITIVAVGSSAPTTTQYTVTVEASPTNGGSVTGGGTYDSGATATLKAVPNSGYVFSKWSDGSTSATHIVKVTTDFTVIATFTASSTTTKVTAVSVTGSSSVAVGATVTLKANVTPSGATDKSVTWSSSNDGVAKVSSAGVVTGVKAGTATITATANDGSGKSGSLDVTVTATTYTVTVSSGTGGSVSPTSAIKGTQFETDLNRLTVTGGTSSRTYTATASTGYEFDHWDVAGAASVDGETNIIDGTTAITAVFKKTGGASGDDDSRIFRLVYSANGGSNPPDAVEQTVIESTSYTFSVASAGSMVYKGHTFKGWATTSTATTAAYQPGSEFVVSTDNASLDDRKYTRTLYAIWGVSSSSDDDDDKDSGSSNDDLLYFGIIAFICIIGLAAVKIR